MGLSRCGWGHVRKPPARVRAFGSDSNVNGPVSPRIVHRPATGSGSKGTVKTSGTEARPHPSKEVGASFSRIYRR
ncbi:hypothetical protein BOO71_0009088 [Deinococcus marmoris]|uniref:Uncharacterized protein n=1 Tax=Deinococcus marmoris TaxID=249408 RepID=A0A1U7NWR1_9DEIO|nr:hypothetical protein BOO71_0009088 [Deinococcus marmoris]